MGEIFGRGLAYGFSSDTADWRAESACRDQDPELFHPLGGEQGRPRTGVNLAQERAAKAVCNRCPVRLECREWALAIADDWGIWGGLNETERRKLRRGRVVSDARAS